MGSITHCFDQDYPKGVKPLVCIAVGLFLFFVGAKSQAQSPKQNDADAIEASSLLTISKTVDEVRLNFTVTDKNGRFIKTLKSDDFQLLDDVRPAERIIQFKANSDSPLRVVLLFDISSSIRSRFGFEQKAANHFLKHVLRPGIDRAAVISFGTDVREVQSMTGDVEKLTTRHCSSSTRGRYGIA
jgi:Ca-activated chloride channel family protein